LADPEKHAAHIAAIRRWQAENPQKYAAAKKRWADANPGYHKQWHEQHPDYYKQYREKHREELAAYGREYRAKRKAARPEHPCHECGNPTKNLKFCSHSCAGKAAHRDPKP
jgi:hypothetical protein